MAATHYLKGRPVELGVLDYGLFRVGSIGRVIGICGFAIRTDQGEVVLIDSGFPAKYALDRDRAAQEDRLGEFGELLEHGPDNSATAQLARMGIAPDQVTLFVTTHTHIDHVGDLTGFPQAPMLIGAHERALPRPLYWRGAQPLDWPDRDYLLVEGDGEIGPGFRVLLVPGHAPGQLAFLLDLPGTGRVLLTSDAISRPSELTEGFNDSSDPAQARASAERLLALARNEGAFVIYGHSPEQWPILRKVPQTYR